MIIEGFRLMFIGISVVFIFLALLVLVINLMSYILSFFPEEEVLLGSQDSNSEVALIIAAIKNFKKK